MSLHEIGISCMIALAQSQSHKWFQRVSTCLSRLVPPWELVFGRNLSPKTRLLFGVPWNLQIFESVRRGIAAAGNGCLGQTARAQL